MNEPSEIPTPDWSKSDQRTEEMIARMRSEEPLGVGLGLGMNQRTIENLGGTGRSEARNDASILETDFMEGGVYKLRKLLEVP